MALYKIPIKSEYDEHFETLFQKQAVKIEKIVSYGIPSPENHWYEQDEDEWVSVLEGWGEIEYANGRTVMLPKGSHTFIPAHEKHRVSKVSNPCIWLAVKF